MNASLNLSRAIRWTARGGTLLILTFVLWHGALVHGQPRGIQGPLRVSQENPRYFTDGSGKAIYLTGSHTWNNLQDMGPTDPPAAFDYSGYLDFLDQHHHNFIWLWRWGLVSWDTAANNEIGGELGVDGKGLAIHTLAHPEITRLQEAYVRKVVDTVNDLDNVLFEISNENHPPSTEWQYHFIRFIHDYERTQPKQHPVGMTFQYQGGKNATLLASPADWVSPNPDADGGYNYRNNPPPADGRKVILSDTDHLWGIGGDVAWVWKSFLRGLNPLFMDPYKREILSRGSDDQWEPVRLALGQTRRFAERMNLAAMTPHPELASTGFCLAQPGTAYLVFQPKAGEPFTVELRKGAYQWEWFDTAKGVAGGVGRLDAPGNAHEFKAPFKAAAILYLKVE